MNAQKQFLGDIFSDSAPASLGLIGTRQKFTLWGAALILFAVCGWVFAFCGLPAIPHISSLLTANQPFYAILIVGILYVIAALLARPTVGRIRPDAPLFCAAIAMLALPIRGGDVRNALLDSGSAGIFIIMTVELIVLWLFVVAASLASRPRALLVAPEESDTATDRLTAVGAQTLATLILLTLIGQSPMKGQAIFCVVLAGLIATLIVHQSFHVTGGIVYFTGTMLAGLVAYIACYFHPGSLPLGDTSGYFAGAARSLPLHYATAGVAGTLYGYWVSGSWSAPSDLTVGEAAVIVAATAATSI